jgi:hypothetical protein
VGLHRVEATPSIIDVAHILQYVHEGDETFAQMAEDLLADFVSQGAVGALAHLHEVAE